MFASKLPFPHSFWEIGTFRNRLSLILEWIESIYIFIYGLCCFPCLSWLVLHLLTYWSFYPAEGMFVTSWHVFQKHLISENVYDDHRFFVSLFLSIHSMPKLLALALEDWLMRGWILTVCGVSFQDRGSAFTGDDDEFWVVSGHHFTEPEYLRKQ